MLSTRTSLVNGSFDLSSGPSREALCDCGVRGCGTGESGTNSGSLDTAEYSLDPEVSDCAVRFFGVRGCGTGRSENLRRSSDIHDCGGFVFDLAEGPGSDLAGRASGVGLRDLCRGRGMLLRDFFCAPELRDCGPSRCQLSPTS